LSKKVPSPSPLGRGLRRELSRTDGVRGDQNFSRKGQKMAEKKVKKGLCGICPSGCGVEITKDGERLHQIKPMEGHPLGIVCTRGIHAEEVVYSADRLQSPMKRVGNRGQYGWRRATSTQSVERGQCESTDRPGEPGSYFRVSGI